MTAPNFTGHQVCRLDLSREELGYLTLQADIGVTAALARIEGNTTKLTHCMGELADAAQIFAASQGPFAIQHLLNRMIQLLGVRR